MKLSQARVTVAGASGFIGRNLVKELRGKTSNLRAVVRPDSPVAFNSDVDYIYADLCTPEGAKSATEDTDIFIMCAAKSSGAEVMATSPLSHLTPNIIMNALTLSHAQNQQVRKYCFISSNTVYPPGNRSMAEKDANGEFFPAYEVVGEMKSFSERMVELHHKNSNPRMEALIVRPGNLYGPYDKFDPERSKVIPSLIRRGIEGKIPFHVWGDGSDIKDFLYIDDFVDALMKVVVTKEPFEILNIASGQSVALSKVIEIIMRKTGLDPSALEYDPSKPSMIPVRRIDTGLINSKYGWSPKIPLEVGLDKTISWYREHTKC